MTSLSSTTGDHAIPQKIFRAADSDRAKHLTYIPERIVGTGAFGAVLQAKVVETKQTVCLKQVPANLVDTCSESGYSKEVLALHELGKRNHPNVMKLYDAFWGQGLDNSNKKLTKCLYFVMEYFPDNLSRILRHCRLHNTPLQPFQILLYAYQLFRGLFYIHSMGYIHFDIKPQNLLISGNDNRLALCDLGCARRIYHGSTTPSPYIQSRYYRAPEVLLGSDRLTCAADIWSAGVVVCEMVLGFPIFHGAGPEEKGVKAGPGADSSNYEMFHEIQKILGSPTKDEIISLNHNYVDKAEQPDQTISRHSLTLMFKDRPHPKGIDDMCDAILQYNPTKRPTAAEVLQKQLFFHKIFFKNSFLSRKDLKVDESEKIYPTTLFTYFFPEEWSTCSDKTKMRLHLVQYYEEKKANMQRDKEIAAEAEKAKKKSGAPQAPDASAVVVSDTKKEVKDETKKEEDKEKRTWQARNATKTSTNIAGTNTSPSNGSTTTPHDTEGTTDATGTTTASPSPTPSAGKRPGGGAHEGGQKRIRVSDEGGQKEISA